MERLLRGKRIKKRGERIEGVKLKVKIRMCKNKGSVARGVTSIFLGGAV